MSQNEAVRHLDVARERFQVATELLRAGHVDDAASRLYYAFFHAAKALLAMQGVVTKTHRGLLHAISEEYARSMPHDLITALRQAQRLRERADYEVMVSANEEIVEVLLQQADAFIDFVEGRITGDGSPRSTD